MVFPQPPFLDVIVNTGMESRILEFIGAWILGNKDLRIYGFTYIHGTAFR